MGKVDETSDLVTRFMLDTSDFVWGQIKGTASCNSSLSRGISLLDDPSTSVPACE